MLLPFNLFFIAFQVYLCLVQAQEISVALLKIGLKHSLGVHRSKTIYIPSSNFDHIFINNSISLLPQVRSRTMQYY